MVCVSHEPDRPVFTTFTIFSDWLSSETPNSLLLGTARLRQRRKWVGWVRCQGMHEGFENDPGNRQECIQKLVEKSAGYAYIIRSTVIPMECHVVPSPCIRCVAKLSGCGAFYRLHLVPIQKSHSPNCQRCCLYLVRFLMLLTQTSNLLSDNAVLLTNWNVSVKCFYDKAKRIR